MPQSYPRPAKLSVKNRTFDTPREALDYAKRLLKAGEISQADFDRVKKQVGEPTQADQVDEFLDKRYGADRRR